jgi:phosphatidylserine/phosphatidylglycerophosphate/cardiolipin synthase-like enzyme
MFVFLTSFISFILTLVYYSNYSEKVIYTYSHNSVFDLKVFLSQYSNSELKNDYFIHSKIYNIDDKIAFLGSVNFTQMV